MGGREDLKWEGGVQTVKIGLIVTPGPFEPNFQLNSSLQFIVILIYYLYFWLKLTSRASESICILSETGDVKFA